MHKSIFHRSELLLGKEMMTQLTNKKAILFGIGGVGSWCAESLIRTGLINLTIVDSDLVCITNVNRQLMATTKTIGQVKTDALKERLLEINPNANIISLQKIYGKDNADDFNLSNYDIIIDAIDSLSNKSDLIRNATKTNAVFVSSMGAALKIDPTRIKVDSFWKVKGCPMARKVRKMVRKHRIPEKYFPCVYSDEVLENEGAYLLEQTQSGDAVILEGSPEKPEALSSWDRKKASINGSLSHITGIFGFTLAGLVLQEIKKVTRQDHG